MDETHNNEPAISQPNETQPSETMPAQPPLPAPVATIVSNKDEPEKESGWWTAAKILGMMIAIPALLAIIVPGFIMVALFVIAMIGQSAPDYDINVTKEKWEKTVERLPKYYNFVIVDEDASTGTLRIKHNEKEFDYTCKNEPNSGGFTKSFKCKYVFGDNKEVYGVFSEVLWFLNEQEVLQAAERVDGVEKIDKEQASFVVEDVDALLKFFDELMQIDDYRVYYEYAYENYEEPYETCFGEDDDAPCVVRDNNPRGGIYVYIGEYDPEDYPAGDRYCLLNLLLESGIKPIENT